jgi:hypothetical protein
METGIDSERGLSDLSSDGAGLPRAATGLAMTAKTK